MTSKYNIDKPYPIKLSDLKKDLEKEASEKGTDLAKLIRFILRKYGKYTDKKRLKKVQNFKVSGITNFFLVPDSGNPSLFKIFDSAGKEVEPPFGYEIDLSKNVLPHIKILFPVQFVTSISEIYKDKIKSE